MPSGNYDESHNWEITEGYSPDPKHSDWISTNNPNKWARDFILRTTSRKNLIPLFYKELLRFLISKLSNLGYIDSENNIRDIKCIHANPERTIAKLNQENNIILPIISINQTVSENDDERRRPDNLLTIEKVWDEQQRRSLRVVGLVPRAVNVVYGINVWTKYKGDSDQIAEQIRLLFNPAISVQSTSTDSGLAFIDSEEDTSQLIPGDKEDRIIKKTFDIKVQTYVPNPKFLISSSGKIEEFVTEYKLT